jgi:DNA-binding PadR family transcriptional regulator
MTNAELAILSLVAEKPRHGYKIECVIEERGMREWTEIGFSSIYYLLKKLEKEGLLEGRMEATGRGPARKVYRATPAGMKVHKEGVIEALSIPQPCYPPLQLGLASLPGLTRQEALDSLRKYQQALLQQLEHVHERWEPQRPLPYFVDAMFEHSIALTEAELQWIEKLIGKVEALEDDQS